MGQTINSFCSMAKLPGITYVLDARDETIKKMLQWDQIWFKAL